MIVSSETIMKKRPLLSVKLLMVVVGLIGLALGVVRFTRQNADIDRAMFHLHLRDLAADDPLRRQTAAEMLGEVSGANARQIVPALAATLVRDTNSNVRLAAAKSLARTITVGGIPLGDEIQDATRIAILALVGALKDPDARVRAQAARSIHSIVTPRPNTPPGGLGLDPEPLRKPLREAAADPEPDVRIAALAALGAVTPADVDAPEVLVSAATDDPDINVRMGALQGLSHRWPHVEPLGRRLAGRLGHENQPGEVDALAVALDRMGWTPTPADLPALQRALRADRVGWGGVSLMSLIGRMGPAARPALPDLLEAAVAALDAPYPHATAAEAIRAIDPESDEAATLLRKVVARLEVVRAEPAGRWFQRDTLIRILRAYGPHARPIAPELRRMAEGDDPQLRDLAAELLEQIDNK